VYSDLVHSTRTDETNGIASESRGLYPDGSTMTSFAVFSLHEINLDRWLFSAGLRWNTFVINVEDEAIGSAQLTPSALVGNAAAMYKLSSRNNLFASFNSGFRAPNIDDLGTLGIVDFRFETPNYNLEPENSYQVQIGYQWQSERFSADVFVYRNALRNLITRVKQDTQTMQGYPVYQKENVEKGYIQGVETAAEYRFGPDWSLQGTLTCTYGQNITKNEPMRRIPPVFGRLALEYNPGAWFASAEWSAAGKQDRLAQGDIDDNRIPDGGTPGWNVVNLYGGIQWNRFSAQLSALNLFNTDYRTHGSGVNSVGRSAMLTLGYWW
jgi:outer membrane receptor protein involved in Fe transport